MNAGKIAFTIREKANEGTSILAAATDSEQAKVYQKLAGEVARKTSILTR